MVPTSPDIVPIKRALLSVSDKTGLVELAHALHNADVALVATGSTAAAIATAGVPVTTVAEVTGFPEILGGRVKTLHPQVHGALLADTANPAHLADLVEHGITPIDLVVVNLYPFAETLGTNYPERVEQIDIGGVALIRAAAKNHDRVAVVIAPEQYAEVAAVLLGAGGFSAVGRQRLAARAFGHTCGYDAMVAAWLVAETTKSGGSGCRCGRADGCGGARGGGCGCGGGGCSGGPGHGGGGGGPAMPVTRELRYGENPHQRARLQYFEGAGSGTVATAKQLAGKEMSYNNYVDADVAWRAVHDHRAPAVVIVKHANPCGVAVGTDIAQAYQRALATDPVSAYGGVVAANREIDSAMAQQVVAGFTEVLIAPDFTPAARTILAGKANLRLLRVGVTREPTPGQVRSIDGGLLVQDRDTQTSGDDPANWSLVAGEPVAAAMLADLAFAWQAVRAVKSNAILLASAGATVGIGMGQVNRVDAARLAVARAKARAANAVAASDAFFPFPDALQVLADAGVRAVVSPGGSKRDPEVIAAAQAAGVSLYHTGVRHFAH